MLTLVDFESQLIVIHGQFLVRHSHSGNHHCIIKMYLHTGLTNNYKRWGDTYGFMQSPWACRGNSDRVVVGMVMVVGVMVVVVMVVVVMVVVVMVVVVIVVVMVWL